MAGKGRKPEYSVDWKKYRDSELWTNLKEKKDEKKRSRGHNNCNKEDVPSM